MIFSFPKAAGRIAAVLLRVSLPGVGLAQTQDSKTGAEVDRPSAVTAVTVARATEIPACSLFVDGSAATGGDG